MDTESFSCFYRILPYGIICNKRQLSYGVNGMKFLKSVLGILRTNKDVYDNGNGDLSVNTAKRGNQQNLAEKILTAQNGKTYLFATGQAGFIIKSAGGQLLAIDLYLSEGEKQFKGDNGFKRLLPVILQPDALLFDVVICTHPHFDHFDTASVPVILKNKRTKLFCSADCEKLVRKLRMDRNKEQIQYIKPGDRVVSGDFDIMFVNCDHGAGAPDAVGVVVKVDGKTIYEAGDTCLRLDRTSEIPQPLDVLIAPVNGAYGNMNEAECAMLAEALQPKVTVPCHYGMFAFHHGDVGLFYEIMKEKRLPLLIMQQGEHFIL